MDNNTIQKPPTKEQILNTLGDKWWRLCHLYHITDKKGKCIPFVPNAVQTKFYNNIWYRNIILKARQMGMSTFISVYMLDDCIFGENISAGIVADTLANAQYILGKARFAFDLLPSDIKEFIKSVGDNKTELCFSNGSLMRVGTSLRSGTNQNVHVSEYGPICRDNPQQAQEIKSGTLNTVSVDGHSFIESTARGSNGIFYDMCQEAMRKKAMHIPLTKLDYRFHFFPWYEDPSYVLEAKQYDFSENDQEYFKSLAIPLTDAQKNWYINMRLTQCEAMKEEYPSTPEEAFEVSDDDKYYAKQIREIRGLKHICQFGIEKQVPVYTAWDLGMDDYTAIWVYQIIGKEIRFLHYLQGNNMPLSAYAEKLNTLDFEYKKHFLPHDAGHRSLQTNSTTAQFMRNLGLENMVLPMEGVDTGIEKVRHSLPNCWFQEATTYEGVLALERYAKKWNAQMNQFTGAKHDEYSHGADAFRYAIASLPYITTNSEHKRNIRKSNQVRQRNYLTGEFM